MPEQHELTSTGAAERLGVSDSTVRRMVQQGRLPGKIHPVTGRVTVLADDADAYLEAAMAAHPAGADLPEDAA